MFDYKYDWILDFININDEEFHDEFFSMMKVVSLEVTKELKDKKKWHVKGRKYEFFLKDVQNELLFMIEREDGKYVLCVNGVKEIKEGEDEVLSLKKYSIEGDLKECYCAKMCVDDEENIYITLTNKDGEEALYPIDYYDVLQNIESAEAKKKKR